IFTLISPTPSKNFNRIGKETLYPESTLNTEIKKKNSKSRTKSVLSTALTLLVIFTIFKDISAIPLVISSASL
ncbi:16776_t:CDS:2, partial [Gigaspora rosea]